MINKDFIYHAGKLISIMLISLGHRRYEGVWENNINAIKFYENQGFEKFDTHVFKLGEDEQSDN